MIFYLRHTTIENLQSLCYGQSEMPLADSYLQELDHIAEELSKLNIEQVFSSPSKRCLRLAHDLFPQKQVCVDDRLRELNFGRWEQKPWGEIAKDQIDVWASNFVHQSPPGGESFESLVNRLQDFHEEHRQQSVSLAVSHGGVLRAVHCLKHRRGLEKAFDHTCKYGSIIGYESDLSSEVQ
ncbi:histidine phosphatase family protein [Pseudobacteriovorax antillogorgiicola]|uniref:Alpha-ribazole phosphatase n=1 Tax=Pseudobacteriovorax antillogorgiicola TaxID=1513793 RepID=A0A1Y6C1B1_9BACT|nr:histidine phosphatase family protein [Pseudobacteriovorax antillogorgiicola]TCS50692.1 alpha-ribazole phosphatase [Pseudobacteriovorax antillogorgiicola]SMF40356.1 alpha-ribazole phosphatase [Pseudobacteriovorax antillogorgiicola]